MAKQPFIAGDTDETEVLSKFPDWREGVAILMERAWLGVLVFAAVVLFFVFQAHRQTPYYRSTATLLVEAQIPKILNYQDILALNVRSLEYFNTHLNALHSRKMRENALEAGGFFERPEFMRGRTNRSDVVDAAASLFTISPVEKSRLIEVSAIYPDPQIACDLANSLAKAYIQQDRDARMNATMDAVEWLRERSEEYREKLEMGLTELQEYRENTGSVSLENDQNIVIEKLKALNSALTVAQTERIQAETAWNAIRGQVADKKTPASKLATLLPDAAVQDAFQKLLEQQREVANLKLRYRAQHPDLQQALELEARLEKQLKQACDDAVFALEKRYQMLVEREQNLQVALQQQEKEAFDLDRKLVRYNELKRNIEADQEIHQAVIARMKEASVAESQPADIIRLAEEARPAKAPFRPQPRQALMRGILFGLVAGLGAIYLFYYADHRFRRNEEVERMLGLSVLATIPLISGKNVAERGQVSHRKKSGEEAEAFRTLRASLLLKDDLRQANVLMITSASPGEGKSLIASNLAITLAQDSRRVLLVGGDLRRPALAQLFNLDKRTKGLADVLEGTQPWRAVIQSAVVPNLDLLPGHTTYTSAELLGKKLFVDFLQTARQFYQHIVIDAPPLLGVSDSLVLLPNMDAVLFVVRYGYTHSLGARHALRRLQESGTPCFGCIMNGVNLNSLSNYYYYRRYGGYAYRQYQAQATPPLAGDHRG